MTLLSLGLSCSIALFNPAYIVCLPGFLLSYGVLLNSLHGLDLNDRAACGNFFRRNNYVGAFIFLSLAVRGMMSSEEWLIGWLLIYYEGKGETGTSQWLRTEDIRQLNRIQTVRNSLSRNSMQSRRPLLPRSRVLWVTQELQIPLLQKENVGTFSDIKEDFYWFITAVKGRDWKSYS